MITYLYHKRHKKTNLNYFGKTTGNPYTYKGSGVYWNDHLRKHGKEIETVQVWEFIDLEKCSKFALEFSIKNNIVESKDWANLCLENGLDGGDKFIYMTKDKLADINSRKSKNVKNSWQKDSRITANVQSAKKQWANRTDVEIEKISNKISKTLLKKTSEQRAESLCKRRETEKKRPPTICSHCGKVGKGLSNMKRYHLDKCKFKSS
jgi:hypothetical protein